MGEHQDAFSTQKEFVMANQILDLAEHVYSIIQPHSKGTVSYSDVCNRLTGQWVNLPPDSPLLAAALGLIVDRCHDVELPALSAVVVHKTGDKMPGNGYFIAAHPGIDDPLVRVVEWGKELALVHKAKYPAKFADL